MLLRINMGFHRKTAERICNQKKKSNPFKALMWHLLRSCILYPFHLCIILFQASLTLKTWVRKDTSPTPSTNMSSVPISSSCQSLFQEKEREWRMAATWEMCYPLSDLLLVSCSSYVDWKGSTKIETYRFLWKISEDWLMIIPKGIMSNKTYHSKRNDHSKTNQNHSKWSGGHPRTHSGVTSTHRHNFASFFPPRVTRAHRLESRAHTAIFQSHPRTQTGITSTHRHNVTSFFPPRVTRPHIKWNRVGWGGVGWGWWHSFALAHMFKALRNGLLRYILYTCPNL